LLVLAGKASWDDLDAALDDHAAELTAFTATQAVQTNEVQRAWVLLPGLLATGAERVDLLELGASAGLLLALDDYDYRYRAGPWGRGEERLVLSGRDRRGPPRSLLARRLDVQRRRGVDRDPVALDDAGARLLEAFVWADQTDRIARLRRAIDVARRRAVPIERGDYVERLPDLLADRRDEALTVVFSSVTTMYLDDERYADLRAAFARAGADGPLAWLSLEGPRDDRVYEGVALDLTTWPGGETRRLARADYHGTWLEWAGARGR
jgi:hypothetical protein